MATRSRTRPRRTSRRRRPKLGAVSGAWLAVAAFFGFLTVVFESITLCVLCVVAVTAAGVALFCPEAAQIAAAPGRRVTSRNRPNPGVNRTKRRSVAKPGIPATPGKTCGARCRRSTKAAHLCDCSCKGERHGQEVGRTFEGSRAQATSKNAKRAERQHVKEKEPWR